MTSYLNINNIINLIYSYEDVYNLQLKFFT